MIGKWSFVFLGLLLIQSPVIAQCAFAVDELDPFDSTRTVVMPDINVGFIIPSEFETPNGYKLVEEGKIVFAYTQDDQSKIESFFMVLGVLERKYLQIESGENVLLAFADSTIFGLTNHPNSGKFDKATNMRIYQHTLFLPLDVYYKWVQTDLVGIRIRYKNKKRDIIISEKQNAAIREALECIGTAVGFFPLDP